MKVTIIGGAGIRVPLVTNGVCRDSASIQVDELSLYDIDPDRTAVIGRIAEAMASRAGRALRVSLPRRIDEALDGASYVLTSIRVGGLRGRVIDESVALEHGVPGQETVGPGGFALALRTIPPLVEYARKVSELAPRAWMINFTNPVGIMSEAFIRAGVHDRCIGVCDTPREHFLHVAEACGIPLESAFFDYLGLNHLGWIRAILLDGLDVLPKVLASDDMLDKVYPVPFFPKSLIRELGLLPTEYLYFYYSTREAYRRTVASGNTRGRLIQDLDRDLMSAVAEAAGETQGVLDAYDHYLASRNASYMALETGGPQGRERIEEARNDLYSGAAGYERIALDAIDAVQNDRLQIMPLNVANRGAIQDLEPEAAVEVPCAIDSNGPRALAVGRIPDQIRELVLRMKEFEMMTVSAALHGSKARAAEALAANPLVDSRDLAERLLHAYQRAHSPFLDYLN